MNWHDRYLQKSDFGDLFADLISSFIGSWKFLIIQSLIFVVWVFINTLYLFNAIQFDPYPFILFNLFMSAEAAYSSPLILMSQNRQTDRDRHQAEMDYQTNLEAKREIEDLQRNLARIEIDILNSVRDDLADLKRDHKAMQGKIDKMLARRKS